MSAAGKKMSWKIKIRKEEEIIANSFLWGGVHSQAGRGHWPNYQISPQSFITTVSYSLA